MRTSLLLLLPLLAAAAAYDTAEPLCAGYECSLNGLPDGRGPWERLPPSESLVRGAAKAAANATIEAMAFSSGLVGSEYFTWKPKYFPDGALMVDRTVIQYPTCAFRQAAAGGGDNWFVSVCAKTREWTRDTDPEPRVPFVDLDCYAGWVHLPGDWASGGQIWGRGRKLWDGTDAAACWLGPAKFTFESYGGFDAPGGALGKKWSTEPGPLGVRWTPPDGSPARVQHFDGPAYPDDPRPQVASPPPAPQAPEAPPALPPNRVELRVALDGDARAFAPLLALALGLPAEAVTVLPPEAAAAAGGAAPDGVAVALAGAGARRRLLEPVPAAFVVAVPDGREPLEVLAAVRAALAAPENAADLGGASAPQLRAFKDNVEVFEPSPPAPAGEVAADGGDASSSSSSGGGLSTGAIVGVAVGGVVLLAAAAALALVVVKGRRAAKAAADAGDKV